jgi:hypothetical protein
MTNFQIPMAEMVSDTLPPIAEGAVFPFGHWTLGIGHFLNYSQVRS